MALTAGLRLVLEQAKQRGLHHVEITTQVDNLASQKVILANGGRQIGLRRKIPAYGGTEELLFRIAL
jgi:predicted acetyltransferase